MFQVNVERWNNGTMGTHFHVEGGDDFLSRRASDRTEVFRDSLPFPVPPLGKTTGRKVIRSHSLIFFSIFRMLASSRQAALYCLCPPK